MRRIVLLPRQIDDRADPRLAAQQLRVPCPVTVLASVELDEISLGLVTLADEHRDPQHRLRRIEQHVSAARALGRQDEADQVGAGLDGGVDVLLPRQAAHLDERP